MSEPQSDLTRLPDLRQKPEHGPVRSRRPIYQDLLPPCNNACPAGEPVQGWLALAQSGQHREAWELRLLEQTQYALFEAFEPDETGEQREEAILEMEARLREHVLG